jgi:hypothetical protein
LGEGAVDIIVMFFMCSFSLFSPPFYEGERKLMNGRRRVEIDGSIQRGALLA